MKENKTTYLNIRIKPTDKELLRDMAEQQKLSLSDYIMYLIRMEKKRIKF